MAFLGLGTINVTNPGRSSAKVAGVQMRGQKAAAVNAVVALLQMLIVLIRVAFVVVIYLVVGTLNLVIWLYETTRDLLARWRFQRQQNRRAARTKQLEEAATQWMASNHEKLAGIAPETAIAAMEALLARAAVDSSESKPEPGSTGSTEEGHVRLLVKRVSLVDGPESAVDEATAADLPVTGMAILATHYRDSVKPGELPDAFYRLDEITLENGPRTIGQELMLEDTADLFGLRLEVRDKGDAETARPSSAL